MPNTTVATHVFELIRELNMFMPNRLLRTFTASFLSVALLAVQAKADSSASAGILMHGEHFADLVLAQTANHTNQRHWQAFKNLSLDLLKQIESGRLENVNEKIDGSPSIVFGFSGEKGETPFIAYKGGFSNKKQILFHNTEDVANKYKSSAGLRLTFTDLVNDLLPAGSNLSSDLRNYIFQGDLLYSKSADEESRAQGEELRRTIDPETGAVRIQSNTLTYEIKNGPLQSRLQKADVGMVFHSVGRRIVREDGRIDVEPVSPELSENLVQKLAAELAPNEKVFVIDPFKKQIQLEKPQAGLADQLNSDLSQIEKRLDKIDRDEVFVKSWSTLAEKMRVFFNKGLNPPETGGIYRDIKEGRTVNAEKQWELFKEWITVRAPDNPSYSAAKEALKRLVADGREANAIQAIEAYLFAVKVHYELQAHIEPAFVSKLGGGEVEGLMLRTNDTIVKFVDRVAFTLMNNQRWNRGAKPAEGFDQLGYPFEQWKPGAIFVLMKAQPPHAGHVAMIKKVVEANPGHKIYVILSQKGPNLDADNWKSLGVASTLKDLKVRKYTYVFSPEMKTELLKKGLEGSPVDVVAANTEAFWSYVRLAKAQELKGSVVLAVGSKEIAEDRYAPQFTELNGSLEPFSIDLTEGGLSATQVRALLNSYVSASDDRERKNAKAGLMEAFSYVPTSDREATVNEVIRAYEAVDARVQQLIAPPSKAPSAPRCGDLLGKAG